jgi:hypothetical protein
MKIDILLKQLWPGFIIIALLALGPGKQIVVATEQTFFQQAELTASDGKPGDYLGHSVAISGDTVVVGAVDKTGGRGAAYVFVRDGAFWRQQAKLISGIVDIADFFGTSVDVDGNTIIVGAIGPHGFSGEAYVFVREGVVWHEQAVLRTTDASPFDYFGVYVGISGNTAVVAADGRQSFTGAAYVFVREGDTWRQQASLVADDPEINGYFGHSVSIDKDTIAVGSDGQQGFTGAAYVFTRVGEVWAREAKLTASDGLPGDYFGHLVSVSGDTVVAGADNKESAAGAAYLFSREGGVWRENAKLTAEDGSPSDHFGWSVNIDGQTVIIGAWGKLDNTGAAYVFRKRSEGWRQQAKLTAEEGVGSDHFGWQVALSGVTLIVTATGRTQYTGSAYVFGGPLQPVIGNESVRVSGESIELSADLVSPGTAGTVGVFFEYGLSAAYGQTTSQQDMSSAGIFIDDIVGLEPHQTYHFRAVADGGSHGQSMGPDMVFVTPSNKTTLIVLFLALTISVLTGAAIMIFLGRDVKRKP